MIADGGSSEPVDVAKQQLRRRLLQARRELTPTALAAARTAVADHVLAGVHERARSTGVHTVAAYEPMVTEPGSWELLERVSASGRRVLVPVVLADRDLDWREWTAPTDPRRPTLGVDAIAGVDVVLVPALAVGPDGARLGRGGGSYDRALVRTPALVVALLHEGERGVAVPVAPHDVAVDVVVDPDGWWPVGP